MTLDMNTRQGSPRTFMPNPGGQYDSCAANASASLPQNQGLYQIHLARLGE